MTYKDLIVEREGKLQILKLNRPKVLNALRERTLVELESVLDKIAGDAKTRVLIITGVGDRAFSSGGDIKEMIHMTRKEAAAFANLAHRILEKMENLPKPILAAVNGLALGAGCDLAIACDLGVASEKAIFGEPPPGVGVVTPFGGTQRLPRIIGPKRAKYLFFTGQTLDAKTAFQMGLINKVVDHRQLLTETRNLASKILTRASTAIGFSKVLINSSMKQSLEEGDRLEVELYAKCFDTYDQKEGMQAFVEKRTPVFKDE
ncbi:MAG: enoyl-CoA hydratase-related protein [Candidatus Bathyarchaeota archaeon]|nr:enoyl-CoA hydratase-related protein [Candidatus Bathyarchaeota archaeon]MDH5732775.1 enoyl-CoA hydratase-related protein [Candidatus Bathyarchaeota archaeon]